MSQESLLPSSAPMSVPAGSTASRSASGTGTGSVALPQATGAGSRVREVRMGVVGVMAGAAGVVFV